MKPTTAKPCRPFDTQPTRWVPGPVRLALLPARLSIPVKTAADKDSKARALKFASAITAIIASANVSLLALTSAASAKGKAESQLPPPSAEASVTTRPDESVSPTFDPSHLSNTAQPSVPPKTVSAPAAPMNSSIPPVHVEEDIRDIRSPRHVRNPWLWAALAVGALALSVGTFGLWLWFWRARIFAKLPYEIALDRLEEARRFLSPDHARDFCIAVSEVIRDYIEVRFDIRAAHRTTSEFLHDLIEVTDPRLATHRAALGEFLQHCDLAKFALWRFSVAEMENMHLSARTFVLQSAIDTTPGAHVKPQATVPKSPRLHLDAPSSVEVHPMPKPA